MTGYLPPEALGGMSIDRLQEQYDLFIAETGLPAMSADELQAEIAGVPQRAGEHRWLGKFVSAWEEAEDNLAS